MKTTITPFPYSGKYKIRLRENSEYFIHLDKSYFQLPYCRECIKKKTIFWTVASPFIAYAYQGKKAIG
jgi:hypothetical protein